MSLDPKPHVFISYVREDRGPVDRLCAELDRHGVAVWLDREKIQPGQRWQIAIRRAIEKGAFFIACFSQAYGNRGTSYMNVELAIAIDQLRTRSADRAWFIPILLEGGAVPDRPIGGGETLRDIQWVDLAADWNDGLRQIMGMLRPESAGPPPTPSATEPQSLVLLMTDLVGSSSAAQRFGDEDLQRMMRNVSQTLRGAVIKHEGKTIRFFGDGMFTTIESAPQAIACAVAIQREMNRSTDLQKLKIRLGLAVGPVQVEEGDVFGSAVNLAARICSLAEGGEILITESLYRLASAGEFQFRERGLVAPKGFSQHFRLFEVRW